MQAHGEKSKNLNDLIGKVFFLIYVKKDKNAFKKSRIFKEIIGAKVAWHFSQNHLKIHINRREVFILFCKHFEYILCAFA